MIVRAGTGWPILMADLSIVLFMVTAAALSQTEPGKAVAAGQPAPGPSPRSEPIAIYRTGKGAPPLAEWLGAQPRDSRQMLTLVSTYRPGRQAEALARAEVLARDATAQGLMARIIVEPGTGDATATLAYDRTAPESARDLRSTNQSHSRGEQS